MNWKKLILLALAISVVAVFPRFWALDRIPPGIYPDEAINGNEGLKAISTGDLKVFYPANEGREGFWINMVGVSVWLFGANGFGLRFWSAFFGTLTVLFLYLLARELFSFHVAFFSSFLLATGFWHLDFSRIAFRAIAAPFLMTASLYFLFRAWRRGSSEMSAARQTWPSAVIGGLLYGLGFHTYIVYRFTPLVVLFLLGIEYFRRKKGGADLRRWLATTLVWLFVAFLVALPIGVYFVRHPGDFLGRASDVSIFSQPHPAREFGTVLLKTAGMFNIRGDCNWRHNLPCSPELLPPVGILFLTGLVVAVKEILQRAVAATGCWVVLTWFGALLLPELLTSEGIPHALRAIGVIPPTFILAGIGADAILKKLKHRKIFVYFFIVILILTGGIELYRYFGIWARNPDTAEEFGGPLVEIGRYLNALPASTPRFVIANELGEPAVRVSHVNPDGTTRLIPMPAQTVMFVTNGNPPAAYLLPEEIAQASFPRGSVIVLLEAEDGVFAELEKRGCKSPQQSSADFLTCIAQ